jgi:hypothetical protein
LKGLTDGGEIRFARELSDCEGSIELMADSLDLYFSEHFGVDAAIVEKYGAFDISVASDLPLFVDPFLLFNSDKKKYQQLHDEILRYLAFLRDEADQDLDDGLINSWYRFKEVKQNWLGYTLFGNEGQGLGTEFAHALNDALAVIFSDFGDETITLGSHLEKLCLIKPGVGKDNISDFTTNLIKGFLASYTQTFARKHLDDSVCDTFSVERAIFSYRTKTWKTKEYYLPRLRSDYVLLTPADLLTRDDTWISHKDMLDKFRRLPRAVPNEQLRAQINRYFRDQLPRGATAKERREAAQKTISRYPALIDYYIRLQEDNGGQASAVSADKVADTRRVLVDQVRRAIKDLEDRTDFYARPWKTSYAECLERARFFKSYIEDNDGYRLLNRDGKPFSSESEVQIAFGLVWCKSDFDLNREVNNGRGPVDFKASFGSGDKSLIEFKLGSNTQLKRNLQKQIDIYEKANRTHTSVKVIVSYTAEQQARVDKILKELKLQGDEAIVLIDARWDNKPSASKAGKGAKLKRRPRRGRPRP